jgi:ABC-2 type transport system ATP-binding protein
LIADGVTIFLTTQYMDEADHLADRIALLDRGKLVAEGTADELKRLIPGGHLRLQFRDHAELVAAAGIFAESIRDDDGLALKILGDAGVNSLKAVLDRLDAASIEADALTAHTPDLDDVFLALTGHPAEKGENDDSYADNQKEMAR